MDRLTNTLITNEFEISFNPYRHVCKVHDQLKSPTIRTTILGDLLRAVTSANVDAIWIDRDLGYRGGRRTGMALTDDFSFEKHLSRWAISSQHPTKGSIVKERTATVIWDVLDQISQSVFLWNVFPFHPYQIGNQFSNRAHNSIERNFGTELLDQLIDLVKPERIIAIGNDAASAAMALSNEIETVHVRHPSYGGQVEFS